MGPSAVCMHVGGLILPLSLFSFACAFSLVNELFLHSEMAELRCFLSESIILEGLSYLDGEAKERNKNRKSELPLKMKNENDNDF